MTKGSEPSYVPAIDLNCDLGESYGPYTIGADEAILPWVTSANIACGFHAGDPGVMRRTVRLCAQHGVQLGAHPGLPDLQGFGRREMKLMPEEAYDLVLYQLGALEAFTRAEGVPLRHVKPHGALYNMAARDRELAEAIAAAVYAFDPTLLLYGLSGSELMEAARRKGITAVSEVFADRTYQADGTLTPRSKPGSVHENERKAVAQVLEMALEGTVTAVDGSKAVVEAQTVCIHGDGPHAAAFARGVREALTASGIAVAPPSRGRLDARITAGIRKDSL